MANDGLYFADMGDDLNTGCFEIMREDLDSLASDQLNTLEVEISRITHRNAANGTLRSGNTIKDVAQSIVGLIRQRSSSILSSLRNRPFLYSDSLSAQLDEVVKQYLPNEIPEFRERFIELMKLVGGNDRAQAAGLEIVSGDCERIRRQLNVGIRDHLLLLKSKTNEASRSKLIVGFEITALVITAFLAGMWAANPAGNYEPWIVLVAVVVAILEAFRRKR